MADPQKTKVALRALYQMIGDTLEEDAQGPSSAATGSAPQRLLAVTPWRELGTPAAAGSFTFTPRLSAPQRELGTPAARSFTPRLSAPQRELGTPAAAGSFTPRLSAPPRELGTPAAAQTPLANTAAAGALCVEDKMSMTFNFLKKRGRISTPGVVVNVHVCVLPGPTTVTPKSSEAILILQQAGLGKTTLPIPLDACHSRIEAELERCYPKLTTLTAGWMFKKSTGRSRERKLHAIPMETGGYTGQQLKDESNGGKNILYIVPVQEKLDTTPLPPDDDHFAKMPKKTCKICGVSMPLPLLASHVDICEMSSHDDNHGDQESPTYAPESPRSEDLEGASCSETNSPVCVRCPICQLEFPRHEIEGHSNYCGESSLAIGEPSTQASQDEDQASTSGLSGTIAPEQEWMATPDPKRAAYLFTQCLLRTSDRNSRLWLCLDIQKSVEEQDRAILSFYKKNNVNWASPLTCKLRGDSAVGDGVKRYILSTISDKLLNGFHINMGNMAVTRLFEGEPGHLLPNTDYSLVESDFFLMAGRMVGHVFLHGGPGLPGLSPAMIHVLGGGAMDTATIVLEDCPDLGFREVLQLLQGDGPIQELDRERIVDLCGSFSVPPVIGNRKWLFERLLHHAVLVLPTRQWKQLRKGLKETGVWPLVQQRPEVVALLFPDSSEICTAQMLLDRIVWPQSGDLQCSCRVASYLREFIDTASSQELTNLLKFWTGWAIPPRELKLEYFSRSLPEASTCFEILRLPDHYTDLMSFKTDIKTCLNSVDYGFGLE